MLTIISLLTAFPVTTNTSTLNFLYSLARKIDLGDFLQRLDALFIFLWILSVFSYLSITTFLINNILTKLTKSSDRNMFAYFVAITLLGISLFPINIAEIKFMQSHIYKYVIIASFGIALFILIFANLKFKQTRKKQWR